MNQPIYVEKCESTNDAILTIPSSSSLEVTGLYTFQQTNGRGQYGNEWESQKDLNLAISVGVPLGHLPIPITLINYYTAVMVRQFVANLTSAKVEIKWPNDLILHQKKVGGLLIEKKKMHNTPYYILGIGININQENMGHLTSATSIYKETRAKHDLHDVAKNLFRFIKEKIEMRENSASILAQYNLHLFKKNKIAVFAKNDIRQNGIIQFVDEKGHLWVELENDGLENFYHKEIEMIY